MTRIKRSARGVAKGILRYRFAKKRKVLPKTRTDLVPSSGKTVAPDRNSVGPLQDKECRGEKRKDREEGMLGRSHDDMSGNAWGPTYFRVRSVDYSDFSEMNRPGVPLTTL